MSESFKDLVDKARVKLAPEGKPRLSNTELASRCGISVTHLYNLMNGAHSPYSSTVDMLAAGLDMPRARILRALKESQA